MVEDIRSPSLKRFRDEGPAETVRAWSPDPTTIIAQAPERPTESPPAEAPIALRVDCRLLEYCVNSVLGQGGFGITYLATDVNLNAKVAIKEYLPRRFAARGTDLSVSPRQPDDRTFYQRGLESFLDEARALATFHHPNIVRVARFFEANGTAYMVLDYERGKSLKTWWRAHANLPERELATLLLPLLDGLALVHESGFLHRDIKPENVQVRYDDGSLVLLDFGAAQQTGRPQAYDTAFVTPGYGPIEQYHRSEQGPWSDIYALGATLYWMISGTKPIDAPERVGPSDPLPPAVEIGKGRYSDEFLRAIDWALKPEPSERPQNIAQFRAALNAAHASSLGLQDALRAGESDAVASAGWRAVLRSPRLLRGRVIRFWRSLLRPSSWPMVVKMTLALVATALAPMLITAYYNLNATIARVSHVELRNLEQLAESVAGRVAQLVGDSGNLSGYLGADEDFVAFLSKPTLQGKVAMKAKLDGLVMANPDVHLLIVMDTAGTALVSSDLEVMGRNFAFREYFKVAMQGRPFTTGIVVGAVAGLAGVFYSNPVFDPQHGKVIGVVVLRIRATSVASILEQARRGNERIPFLLDRDGVVIYHPNRQMRYRSLVALSKDRLDAIIVDQRFRRDKIESLDMPDLAKAMVGAKATGNISYFSTISGKHEIAGYAPVKGPDWVVGVTELRESFAAPIEQLFENVLYSVMLVGAVFLLLALLFARSIVRPISELTGAARALKAGDYDKANIKVTSRDEIGRLARTFNIMIDVLRQRERERTVGGRRSLERRFDGGEQP